MDRDIKAIADFLEQSVHHRPENRSRAGHDLEALIIAQLDPAAKEAIAQRIKEVRSRCNELIGHLTP